MSDHCDVKPLMPRIAAHWLEALKALQFSEGWPEGPSYWIYNRAEPYPLAADCFISATGGREESAGVLIRSVMRKAGLWQLYQYGPNGVFEPYGDSAGSLRLGETGWWTVTMDHYAKVSQDPALAAAADFFRNRSPAPYGKRPYYWYIAVSYDPELRPRSGYDPLRPEAWLSKNMPQSMLFGRRSYGVAFFRGQWGNPDELFASFKAGDLLAHHDHYDVGTFTIQRGGNLVPQTGYYGSYFDEHRLGYQVQTVSANSLLVLAPGEFSEYLAGNPKRWRWLSGGQRVISPTGFNCCSLEHFRKQLRNGPHLERAEIVSWESQPNLFDYVAADITAAYNSTVYCEHGNEPKVSLVTRQFLYLRSEEVFVIYDRVETTNPRFVPKFVLHSLSNPLTDHEELIVGDSDNGILETSDKVATSGDGDGKLRTQVVLPEKARILKIGGPDYAFYVEYDGDQEDGFDGKNLTEGIRERGDGERLDQWRIEVEPDPVQRSTRYLIVLQPELAGNSRPVSVGRVQSNPEVDCVRVGRATVAFARRDEAVRELQVGHRDSSDLLLLLDAVPGISYNVGNLRVEASKEGVLTVHNPPVGSIAIKAD